MENRALIFAPQEQQFNFHKSAFSKMSKGVYNYNAENKFLYTAQKELTVLINKIQCKQILQN